MSGMLPTASSHGRALMCPASAALPQERSKGGAAADAGTERHEALRLALLANPVSCSPEVGAWLEQVMPVAERLRDYRAEVALGYSVIWDEGRVIGHNVGRDYGNVGADEFVGSADYLAVRGERIEVADLKTGRLAVDPPERNQQLLTLALAASRAYGTKGGAKLVILRAPESQEPQWVEASVEQEVLEQHAQKLSRWFDAYRQAVEDVAAYKEPRHLVAGAHCRFCPARGACPKLSASMVQATTAAPTFRDKWRAALASGDAATVYALRQALRGEVELLDDALRDAARAGPLRVGEGKVFAWKQMEHEVINAEKAWQVLGDAYGLDIARAAMTLDTSKAGVERAMRKLVEAAKAEGKKVTLKAEVEAALRKLREAGAVEKKSTERCEEQKA